MTPGAEMNPAVSEKLFANLVKYSMDVFSVTPPVASSSVTTVA